MKRLLLLSITTALLLVGCTTAPDTTAPIDDAEARKVAVEVMEVVKGDISAQTKLAGKVVANREVAVMPPIPGKVATLKVKLGDKVAKNQVLFTMDKDDINKQYKPLKDNYDRTKRLMDESLALATENLENTRILFDVGAASKAQVDQLQLALLQQETQMQGQLDQLSTNMDSINDTLKDTSVRAPIAGVVTSVSITEGTMASNASPSIMVAETHISQVRIDVAETLIPYIQIGDTVTVEIPSVSSATFDAKIQSIAPSTDMQTQLYNVKIDLPQDQTYTVGMFANVVFTTSTATAVISVPSDAILTDEEQSFVYIIEDGIAKKMAITTGKRDSSYTEVTTGLLGGEQLVTKGQSYLKDQTVVRIVGGQ